jgi:FkbM family methyltransferase
MAVRPGRLRGVPVRALDALLRRQIRACGLIDVRGHHILASGLDAGSLVLDAGAHRGEFSGAILERFGCTVVALEPAPDLFAAIPERAGLVKLNRALAGGDGRRTLHLSQNPEAHSLEAGQAALEGGGKAVEVEACSLQALWVELGRPADLVKLDIEGAEIEALDAAPDELLRSIGQLSVEFHDFQPGHTRGAAVERIMRRLASLGFETLPLSRPFGHHADTLFLNRRVQPPSVAGRLLRVALRRLTLPLRRAVEWARTRASGASSLRFPYH